MQSGPWTCTFYGKSIWLQIITFYLGLLICFAAKSNKKGFSKVEPGQGLNLSSISCASFSRSFLVMAALMATSPPARSPAVQEQKKWGILHDKSVRKWRAASGEDEEKQNKCKVWKQLDQSCLPVCKRESVIIYAVVQLDFIWICITARWIDNNVSRGKIHSEFQTRL